MELLYQYLLKDHSNQETPSVNYSIDQPEIPYLSIIKLLNLLLAMKNFYIKEKT